MDAPLPLGLTARALTTEDVDAVLAMINACEMHDSGRPMWERADLLADASTDGFDPERDWIGVFDGTRPVGWAMIVHRSRGWADVLPDERERGIGTWLRTWLEARGRATGGPPSTLATWRAMTIEREDFVPDNLVLSVHGGEIVGGAFLLNPDDEIWIDKLAVRADHRHRGVARGMLHLAFRRSFERGYDHTSLSTDSRTGALTLYERIGMRVVESFTNWAIDL